MRIEVQRGCGSDCGGCGDTETGTHIHLRAWLDCTGPVLDAEGGNYNLCGDVTSRHDALFDAIPGVRAIERCLLDPGQHRGASGDFDTVKMGFSAGAGAFVFGMQITRFAAADTNLAPQWQIPPACAEIESMPLLRATDTAVRFLATDLPFRPEPGGLVDREAAARNGGSDDYGDNTLWIRRVASLTTMDPITGAVSLEADMPGGSDRFGIAAGGASFTEAGGVVVRAGRSFGRLRLSGGALRVTFDDSAGVMVTQALMNEVLSRLTYGIPGGDRPAGVALELEANDSRGGTNATARTTVGVRLTDD